VVRVPLPKATANVTCDLNGGNSHNNQSYEYEPGTDGNVEKKLRWMIKKFPGNTELAIRIRVTLSAPVSSSMRKEVGPVSMGFEVPMYNVSSLQVKYLRIADQGKAYNPYRFDITYAYIA
jgi:AP-4 complex subunit mu-1